MAGKKIFSPFPERAANANGARQRPAPAEPPFMPPPPFLNTAPAPRILALTAGLGIRRRPGCAGFI